MTEEFDTTKIPSPLEENSVPRWLGEDYKGKTEEIRQSLYSVFYWLEASKLSSKNGKKKPKDTTAHEWLTHVLLEYSPGDRQMILHRLGSTAALAVVSRADNLKDDFGVVYLGALWQVNKRKLWSSTPDEYSTFREFLVDAIPRLKEDASNSELSDTEFIVEQVMPLLENVGGDFSPKILMDMRNHWSKTRSSVPYLRRTTIRFNKATESIDAEIVGVQQDIVAKQKKISELPRNDPQRHQLSIEMKNQGDHLKKLTEDKTKIQAKAGEEFSQAVQNVLKIIADKDIPNSGATGVAETLKKLETGEERKVFKGTAAIVGKGTLFFFEVPSSAQRAIEGALKHIVDFDRMDAGPAVEELYGIVFPKQAKQKGIGKHAKK